MSIVDDARKRQGPVPAGDGPPSSPGPRPSVSDLLATHLGALEECGHDALLDMTLAPPSWLVEGFVIDEGLTWLGGKKKLGKSWLCLQIAQAVGRGTECLGRKAAQGSVVYICLEDGRRRIKSRLEKQHTPRGLPITYFTRFPPLDGDGMGYLLDLLAERKPRLLILDTLAAAKTGKVDEDKAGGMGDLSNALRALGQFYHAGVLVTHHHGKMLRGDPGDDLRGSSAMGGAGDVNLGLYREQGGHVLRGEGRDMPNDFSIPLKFDPEDSWCWQVREDQREVARDRADQEALDALEALGEADAATVAAYLQKSESRTGERLRKLAGEGLVLVRPRGETGISGRPRILYRLDGTDYDDEGCNPPGGF